MFQPAKLLIHPQNSLTLFFFSPPWHPICALWDLGQSSGTTLLIFYDKNILSVGIWQSFFFFSLITLISYVHLTLTNFTILPSLPSLL